MIIHKIFSYYSNLAILVFCFFAPSALSKTRFSCGHKLIRVSKVHPYVLTQINYPRYVSQLLDIVKGHSDILEIIEIGKVGSEPLYKIITKVPAAYSLKKARARVLITAGIHGNESLALVSLIKLLKYALNHRNFLTHYFELVIYPNLNPYGIIHNQRNLVDNKDLNRVFRDPSTTENSKLLTEDLRNELPFDMALDLHGAASQKASFVLASGNNWNLATRALKALNESSKVKSDSGLYPGMRSGYRRNTPYNMVAPGIAKQQRNNGNFKDYASQILNIPHAFTVEYPMQAPIHIQLNSHFRLLLSLFFNLRKIDK